MKSKPTSVKGLVYRARQARLWLLVAPWLLMASLVNAQDNWRSEPLTPIDRQYMASQRELVDDLARRHMGRQLNGSPYNDLPILQRLLDDGQVRRDDIKTLQAMGILLGMVLEREHKLYWAAYIDARGRSRALQLRDFEKEFIFPVTQISRLASVGAPVDVQKIYAQLEEAVEAIRNKPPF